MSTSDNHLIVLLENIDGKIDGLAESMTLLNERLIKAEQINESIPQIAKDIQTIKLVQREQGQELRDVSNYLVGQGMPQRA